MERTRKTLDQNRRRAPSADIVDFDQAQLAAVPAEQRAELLAEAALLAQAFAPAGRAEEVLAMASVLAEGARDGEDVDATRARQLATALRCLARGLA